MLLTNQATFDQRPLKEAHSLVKAGRRVTILAWDRDLETESDNVFPDGLAIKRLRLRAGLGRPYLTALKQFVFYLWCLAHLVGMKTEAIHAHDVDTLPVGFFAKVLNLNRPKLVYDMHDLPEAFLKYFPFVRYTQTAFLASARRLADAVIVVNDKFVDYLATLGFDKNRLVVVMNAPPTESGQSPHRRRGGFNILYYGWITEERGVKVLVDAIEGLGGVTLTLAGKGDLEGWVRNAAAKSPSVKYLGWVKMEILEPLVREADLVPSLYEPRTKNGEIATPGKLMTAMSLSLPCLVPSGSYQAEIVTKFLCGVVVNWNDVAEVRSAIKRLATDPKLYDSLATASYNAFCSSFSWEVMETRLKERYDRLLGRDRAMPG
jgi:glycosyltransferase involved in cell wall biosynthesis